MVISLPECPPAKSCVAAGWWQQPVATLHLHEHDARILGEIWEPQGHGVNRRGLFNLYRVEACSRKSARRYLHEHH